MALNTFIDEVLASAPGSADTLPRYNIVNSSGEVVATNAQIILQNIIETEGTKVNAETMNAIIRLLNTVITGDNNVVPVAHGGTGVTTLADLLVLIGKGVVNGIASLDSNSKVTAEQASAAFVTKTASFTLDTTLAGKFVPCAATSGTITVTIPTHASVAIPVGTEIEFWRSNTAEVIFSPASGVTLMSINNARSISDTYGIVCLKKTSTNNWVLAGSII